MTDDTDTDTVFLSVDDLLREAEALAEADRAVELIREARQVELDAADE